MYRLITFSSRDSIASHVLTILAPKQPTCSPCQILARPTTALRATQQLQRRLATPYDLDLLSHRERLHLLDVILLKIGPRDTQGPRQRVLALLEPSDLGLDFNFLIGTHTGRD